MISPATALVGERAVISTIVKARALSDLAADEQDPVDGREPVRLERHRPVDRGEGHGEGVEHQADRG
jgi:hypothetical protein